MYNEEWRAVVGYEGKYEVSSIGSIRSKTRCTVDKHGVVYIIFGQVLAPHLNRRTGYYQVMLSKRGQKFTHLVHREMVRAFIGLSDEQEAEHIDRVKTHNVIGNLRPASTMQNQQNVGVSKRNTSGFKGVSEVKERTLRKPWRASIAINGVIKRLGYFKTARDAAKAYDKAALKYHGQFACINGV